MDQYPLNRERGGMVFELLFILPIVLVALMLLFAVFRAVEGSWATTVASRLAAWTELRGPEPLPSAYYDQKVRAMTAEITQVDFHRESGPLRGTSAIQKALAGGSGLVDLVPGIGRATTRSLVIARAESRSRSPWSGTVRSTTVVPGTFTSVEAQVSDRSYRAAVETITALGLVGALH